MNETQLPARIVCKLTYNGYPMSDLMVLFVFKTLRKNDYHIVAGPSDQEGHVVVEYDQIKKQANSQLESALMDFVPIEKAFSGNYSANIMSCEDIISAISAYELFKSIGWYPENYIEHLKKALHALSSNNCATENVKVEILDVQPLEEQEHRNIDV